MKGYAGKAIRANLTTGKINFDTLTEEFCEKWIGGYGFAAKILWDELKAGLDPLNPDNVLIYAMGPVPGTILPTSSKYGVFAKSPLTGLFGMAISSGSVGQQLKRAGYDMIIITGRAEKPVYMMVDDNDVTLKSAEHLWGERDCWETEDIIREEMSDMKIAVASIGQAGENLSKIACITNDRNRQAGRTGMGTVMGSKNLKAIAMRGSKEVEVAQKDEFMQKALKLIKIANGPATKKYRDLGTPANVMVFQKLGILPTRNFQEGRFEAAEIVSGETMRDKWVAKKSACSCCPIGCDHICTAVEGPYAGTVSSVDFESIFALGTCCGLDYFPAIIRAIELCDRYGIDTMSGGVTISHAMECFEKGLITTDDTGGIELKFGNHEAEIQFIEDMTFRKTKAGDIWADGSKAAAEKIGKGSDHFAMHSKGLELPGYLLRGLKTAAVGFAVSIRGGCHLRNGAYSPDVKGKFDRLKEEPGRAKAIIGTENIYGIIDSLIICKFTRGIYENDDEMAEVYNLITGIPMDAAKLKVTGERIVNLSKCFNIREGWKKGDDTLPPRCFKDPVETGDVKNVVVDEKGFTQMVEEYYVDRGWTKEGIPTAAKLKKLGLQFAIEGVGAK
ncbi:MAG: aldehyde ferredoxin oxidoreductase family protein [Candidatus Helarchaeota archaeon]|nr:aldehyde ferredoxin oxidoreductase family protein [Candidatus Helarchaeota archaeon]